MNRLKAIIVEDDKSIQVVIAAMINQHAPDIDVVDMQRCVSGAVESIATHAPDVVFLDIEIMGGTGFDVLSLTKTYTYQVIFITGHSNYAIEALRADAIDYVMKPILSEDFINALMRLYTRRAKLHLSDTKEGFIIYGTLRDTKVKYEDILYIVIEKGRTCFYLSDDRFIRSPRTVAQYDLDGQLFQIHRSYLVNINYIAEIEPGRGGYLIMKDGSKLPIAYRRKKELKELWERK